MTNFPPVEGFAINQGDSYLSLTSDSTGLYFGTNNEQRVIKTDFSMNVLWAKNISLYYFNNFVV